VSDKEKAQDIADGLIKGKTETTTLITFHVGAFAGAKKAIEDSAATISQLEADKERLEGENKRLKGEAALNKVAAKLSKALNGGSE